MSVDGSLATSPAPEREAGDGIGLGSPDGELIVAWQNPTSRLIAPVGLLEHHGEEHYRFRYLRRAPSIAGFALFLSFPHYERDYRSPRLFPLFSQRVMSPRRPDYAEFLHQLHLTTNASPWDQLARSEGRRTGDTVQVFPVPSVHPDGATDCRFLVHGTRYCHDGRVPHLAPGTPLDLEDDPANEVNADAVRVVAPDRQVLGYVPDLLLEHLRVARASGSVRISVEHVNGPEAPMHLRLLARMEGVVPVGYRPMRGPRWDTFV